MLVSHGIKSAGFTLGGCLLICLELQRVYDTQTRQWYTYYGTGLGLTASISAGVQTGESVRSGMTGGAGCEAGNVSVDGVWGEGAGGDILNFDSVGLGSGFGWPVGCQFSVGWNVR
jgi:hypothetical protein